MKLDQKKSFFPKRISSRICFKSNKTRNIFEHKEPRNHKKESTKCRIGRKPACPRGISSTAKTRLLRFTFLSRFTIHPLSILSPPPRERVNELPAANPRNLDRGKQTTRFIFVTREHGTAASMDGRRR